jgi:hypothetical protein
MIHFVQLKSTRLLLLCLSFALNLAAQDPVGTLEGTATDKTGGAVANAIVSASNLQTGYTNKQTTTNEGLFRFGLLPIGRYSLTVEAPNFARFRQEPIDIAVSQTLRVDVRLDVVGVAEVVTVTGEASLVDTSTNTLGKTVSGREVLDLPLNGRNFTQLGLLQNGVAPLTPGIKNLGGPLRANQAYAVNGQRPESNNYLVDGAQNIDRLDAGYALKIPVDAIAEFRILTLNAPPEYGGFTGSTTTVVTRSGGNDIHGTAYEFFRNDLLDARNFFSRSVEPLKQNQFGATIGAPLKKNRLFVFGYYEGFRNRQGITQSSTVPTAAQRAGDFSGLASPLVDFSKGGAPFPGGKIPVDQFNAISLNVIKMYPLGNTAPSVFTSTEVTNNDDNRAGIRLDFNKSERDQFFGRYSWSKGVNLNPIDFKGSPLPGFPTRDDLVAQSAVLSNVHVFSPKLSNSLRGSYFRYLFNYEQRLNKTPPSAFGFQYESASALGQGPPYFNVSGYSPVGSATSGPRNSAQNTFEVEDALSWFLGKHSIKVGGEFRRNQVNIAQPSVPNGLIIFSPSFPTSDSFANLLLGRPVVFYQGIGFFDRGLRSWNSAAFFQDEYRVTRGLTLNFGMRWEVITPTSEIENRLNTFVPGVQSKIHPDAPKGVLYPGDDGVSSGLAPIYKKAFMPRLGVAWDPTGAGVWSIRTGVGIFYDPFSNGMGLVASPAVSAAPWAQYNQFTGNINFANPYIGHGPPVPGTFAHPSTILAMDNTGRPPYALDWNFAIQRSLRKHYLLEMRYVGTKGTHLPRNREANPAVYRPGATSSDADRRRIYANCKPNGGACELATAAVLTYGSNSTYEAGQVSLSRRYAAGFGFNVSYWFSKTLDYLSSLNVNNSSGTGLAGENDLAQNPFNLRAEHGPSLFDARHRFVASGSWELPIARRSRGVVRALLHGWQANLIASANSGSPFTVYDSANVALQASSPPLSAYFASRPDVVGDPHAGPHTVEQWLSRTSFRRLNPKTEAGNFGNAGRNIALGPAFGNLDTSLMKNFRFNERWSLQFRAESFNTANHPNFAVPVADLASPNFGRILSASPARLSQLALKLLF